MSKQAKDRDDHKGGRLTAAVVTGLLAGAARAVTEWLLRQLTAIW
jgi:hypothetical protein